MRAVKHTALILLSPEGTTDHTPLCNTAVCQQNSQEMDHCQRLFTLHVTKNYLVQALENGKTIRGTSSHSVNKEYTPRQAKTNKSTQHACQAWKKLQGQHGGPTGHVTLPPMPTSHTSASRSAAHPAPCLRIRTSLAKDEGARGLRPLRRHGGPGWSFCCSCRLRQGWHASIRLPPKLRFPNRTHS